MKKFCPNCGQPLKDGATFCPNCGAKITQNSSVVNNSSSRINSNQTRTVQNPAPHKPMSKKNKIIISIVAVLAVICIGTYMFGKNYYSRDHQIDRIVNGIKQPNSDLAKYVIADDSSVKVTKNSVKPYQKLLSNEKSSSLKSELANGGTITNGELVENGKYFLFFPKYQLKVKTYSPKVETNHQNSTLYVNGSNVGKFSQDGSIFTKTANHLLAGKYTFLVKTKVSGRNLQATSSVNASDSNAIDMSIETRTFTVKGLAGSSVYINDNKVGTLDKNGEEKFDNYPITKEMSLYITTTVNKKPLQSVTVHNLGEALADSEDDDDYDYDDKYSSDEVKQDDNGDYIVTPTWRNVISNDDAQSLFQSVFDDLDSDDFIGGSSNSSYADIKKMQKGFDNDDDVYGVDYDVDIETISPAGGKTSYVTYKVTYKFDMEDYTKTQVMEYPDATVQKDGDDYMVNFIGKGRLISTKKSDD